MATFLTRTVQLGANTQAPVMRLCPAREVYLAAGGDGGYAASGGKYFDNMAPGAGDARGHALPRFAEPCG